MTSLQWQVVNYRSDVVETQLSECTLHATTETPPYGAVIPYFLSSVSANGGGTYLTVPNMFLNWFFLNYHLKAYHFSLWLVLKTHI